MGKLAHSLSLPSLRSGSAGFSSFANRSFIKTVSATPDTFDPQLVVSAGTTTWDMGDTNILVGNTISHIYVDALPDHEVNISGIPLTNILGLRCETDDVIDINFKGLVNLNDTRLRVNLLTSLDLTPCKKMTDFQAQDMLTLKSVNLGGLLLVEIIRVHLTALLALNISQMPKLRILTCHQTSIKVLDFTNKPDLVEIRFDVTPIESFNINNSPLLGILRFSSTIVETVDISGFPLMLDLRFNNTNVGARDIDQVLLDLDSFGLINGLLEYSASHGRPTSVSLAAYNNLIGKGWTITGNVPEGFYFLTIEGIIAVGPEISSAVVPNWRMGDLVEIVGLVVSHTYTHGSIFEVCLEDIAKTDIIDIDCPGDGITEIDLSGLTNLNNLYLGDNDLSSLDITGQAGLLFVTIKGNQNLTFVDFTTNKSMQILQAGNSALNTIDFLAQTSIIICFLQNNNLDSASIDNVLINIDLQGNNGGILNYSGNANPTLASLIAYNNLILKGWTITGAIPA